MNLLINESSPYLLQHANNPVHWQAWSPEALAQAQTQNKPILVSIGYAACHWCHVMEHESFENKEVAALMNTYFVNIKIDREERPDLDAIYMDAVQAMGVHGGWPLNVFLMPDGKPFYGGTYFPKANWMKLLQSVADGFLNSQDKLQESADKFALHISQSELIKYNLKEEIAIFEKEDFEKIFQKLSHHFDYEWGGFDRAPKFPMPCIYEYLKWDTSSEASLHLKLSLDKITLGGIYDQIGGGFARYSVDERWFCPHFEKMLYDNAQLLEIYAQTARLFRNHPIVSFRESATLYQETINETVQWLQTEMLNQEGAFYSAIDADSEGIEGKYYTWQSSEIEQILGDKSADFKEAYQITEKGNWEENNILWKKDVLLNSSFKNEINLLKQHRQQRIRPTTDDKILTSWNAMAISGLVESYHATFENEYIEIATKNADFIVEKLYSKPTLFHTYKNGKAKILGFLDDYAHVIKAFIKLYQATFEEKYLEIAEQMCNYVLENFYDYDEQMFFYTDKNAEKLIARKKEIFDNVIPASNSVMAQNLYVLGKILDRNDFENLALSMLGKMKKLIVTNPDYLCNWAVLAQQVATPLLEIVIVGKDYLSFKNEILKNFYHPNSIICGTAQQSPLPWFKGRNLQSNDTLIYICINKTCKLPQNNVKDALDFLEKLTQA